MEIVDGAREREKERKLLILNDASFTINTYMRFVLQITAIIIYHYTNTL